MARSLNVMLFVCGIVFGTVFSSLVVFAWTGPTQTAPASNVSAPINVGTIDQIKNAGLGVNSLAVYGNTILSGTNLYLNFGNTAGASGYGIRDNAGTLEFKNSGGNWTNMTTVVSNYLTLNGLAQSAGTVSSIKFSDGTTQTTAPAAGGGSIQIYRCPVDYALPSGGAWASFGCLGQLSTVNYCQNLVYTSGIQYHTAACTATSLKVN